MSANTIVCLGSLFVGYHLGGEAGAGIGFLIYIGWLICGGDKENRA